ncbi:MAG: hypothetical protein AB2A00_04350 [Myxococcota bacterium]
MNAAALALLLAFSAPTAGADPQPAPSSTAAGDDDPLTGRAGKLVVGIATLAAGGLGTLASVVTGALFGVVMAAIVVDHADDDGVLAYDTTVKYDDDRDRFLWTEAYRVSTLVVIGAFGAAAFSLVLLAVGAGVLLSALVPVE